MSITPVTPAENSKGKVKTWVNSQWKFRPKVGQFLMALNTTGKAGVLVAGGVEWMQAGGGVWHTADPTAPAPIRGHQLWLGLPEALEKAAPHSEYLAPDDVPPTRPGAGDFGSYQGVASPLPATSDLTYLHVALNDGEIWTYAPPSGHGRVWLAVDTGVVQIGEDSVSGEIAVFKSGVNPISMRAIRSVNLMNGSVAQHPHNLVLGHYSVHTTLAALVAREAGIHEVGERLRRDKKL